MSENKNTKNQDQINKERELTSLEKAIEEEIKRQSVRLERMKKQGKLLNTGEKND